MKKSINYAFVSISITYILVIIIGIIYFIILDEPFKIPPCPILTHLHILCPACGGTRAILALLKFDIISSLYYNPIVLYTLIFTTIYILNELFNIFLKKRLSINYKKIIIIGVILLFSNFIIKNIINFFIPILN